MPPSAKELEDVEALITMMDGNVAPEIALSTLRASNGEMDKAAIALLENDRSGMHIPTISLPGDEAPRSGSPGPRTPPREPEQAPAVIDLTADDEDKELSLALKASLEDQPPKFGPSERAPDPNWAVVPSNVVETGASISQDDQSLSRAIEASLQYDYNNDYFEELPLEERVRKGGRPIALRPSQGTLTHAGLILHGLFYVPQVRHYISKWRPPLSSAAESEADVVGEQETGPPTDDGPDMMLWSLLEIFAHMDLVQTSELNIDAAIAAFAAEHWSTPVERPGDVSFQFYSRLAWTIEATLHPEAATEVYTPWPRLLHFRYGFSDADLSQAPFDRRLDLSVVKVDIRGSEDTNDLVSCLSSELSLTGTDPSAKQQVIFEASDVVAFQLIRDNLAPPAYSSIIKGPSGTKVAEKQTFKYPVSVYLDQFLKDNMVPANQKRARRHDLNAEVESLLSKKDSLLRFKDRDTLVDLRSSLHYYENVAEHNDDPDRKAEIHDTALKLRKILTRIENELQTIDAAVVKLRNEAANAFECPELQQHRYDLRVVLVHDGLFGRSHIYSYVKDKGIWWKTVDYAVTQVRSSPDLILQVSEDIVLNDPIGLHLGAGPFFLIYSRALAEEEENRREQWPEDVKNSVKHNNGVFLTSLPPEVAVQVVDPNSPPSSPYYPPTPSEYTISSEVAEPALSREEPMDTTD
ncbi:hypothetical protein BKA93DRAFT_726897 [Sparassis latifolia]